MASTSQKSHLDNVKSWAAKYDLNEELEILLQNGFVNLTSISFIDEKDLDEMKITKLGSRKKILAGVNELNAKIGKLRNLGGSLADIHNLTSYIAPFETVTNPSTPSAPVPVTIPKLEELNGDALIEYFEVRRSVLSDVAQMCAIFNYYCKNYPEITADEIGKTEQQFTELFYEQDERHSILVQALIKEISGYPVGTILGYIVLKKFVAISGYNNVAEFSQYLHKDFRSKGIGMAASLVMSKLLYKYGFEKVINRVSGSNIASIKLNQKLGFVKVATIPEICTIKGKKEDLVIFQKDLMKDREVDEPRINALLGSIHQTVI